MGRDKLPIWRKQNKARNVYVEKFFLGGRHILKNIGMKLLSIVQKNVSILGDNILRILKNIVVNVGWGKNIQQLP